MATKLGRGVVRQVTRVLGVGLLWLSACQHGGAQAGAATPGAAQVDSGAQAASSALRGELFRYRFGIYASKAPSLDLAQALAEAARACDFKVVSESVDGDLPPTKTSVLFAQPPIEKFAPPNAESMQYFADELSEAEQRRFGASQYVAVFEVVGPGQRAFDDYRKALKLSQDLARQVGGFLWDEETRTAHTVESWQRRLESWQAGVPFVNQHVAIHQYRDGELFRLVSLGMIKLGLPDIAVNQVAGNDADEMGVLINLLLQRFVEGATPDAKQQLKVALEDVQHPKMQSWLAPHVAGNAQGNVVVSLALAQPEEGDSENRLFELSFPGDPGRVQERQAATLAALFGATDSVLTLEHDAALLAASQRARKKAFALRERFAKGPPFGEELLVKAPFETPEGNEWIWVEVVSWQGNAITGVLTEDAFEIPTLKAGSRVEVQADKIFDYLLRKRDGSKEGNETEPLLEARARSRRDK